MRFSISVIGRCRFATNGFPRSINTDWLMAEAMEDSPAVGDRHPVDQRSPTDRTP
jgi:hypothetical protein